MLFGFDLLIISIIFFWLRIRFTILFIVDPIVKTVFKILVDNYKILLLSISIISLVSLSIWLYIFLKTSLNAVRKARGEKELDAIEFLKLVKEKSKELKFDEEKLNRQLNVGFSGGEKKKNEILQMSLLEPKLSILDETDSGLDIDALKIVAEGVNTLRDKKNSFLIITHYQRLLDYIKPDFVHVLMNGKIVKSGGPDLALELEKKGYENFH